MKVPRYLQSIPVVYLHTAAELPELSSELAGKLGVGD